MNAQISILSSSSEKPEQVFNVASNSLNPIEAQLSNLALSPFELDGKIYASVEGFWQGLKFPEEKRERIAAMYGISSKKIGSEAVLAGEFVYMGQTYIVGSPEHQGLMRRAIRAKLEQNPDILELLLATGSTKIIHEPRRADGTPYPDSTAIPGVVFAGILTGLREELRNKSLQKNGHLSIQVGRVIGMNAK